MSHIKAYIRIANLLAKEQTNGLSEGERKILEEWRYEKDENTKIAANVKDKQKYDLWLQQINRIDHDEAWKKVESHTRKSVYTLQILKYAAGIVLVISMWWLFQQNDHRSIEERAEAIVQDTASVYLTLADGNHVNLSDSASSTLEERDGTNIIKEMDGISYIKKEEVKPLALVKKLRKHKALEPVYNRINVPRGADYKVLLADGTTVIMNSNSELRFPVQFNETKREVKLSGEAYFKVAHDARKPFIIDLNGTKVTVLGTEFNVKNYANENFIATTLVQGKVKIEIDGVESVILSPNQQAHVDKLSMEFSVHEVDVNQYTAWMKGVFLFKDSRLEDIMKTLARWYDMEVEYSDVIIKDIRFGGILAKKVGFEGVLRMFDQTDGLIIEIDDKKVKFSMK